MRGLPVGHLRQLAAHLCDARTRARVIEPFLADLAIEDAEAARHGRPWRRRWIRAAGYAAFVKVVILCALGIEPLRDWPEEDRESLRRVLTIALGTTVAAAVLIAGLPIERVISTLGASDGALAMYVVPEVVPVVVPIGVTFGRVSAA